MAYHSEQQTVGIKKYFKVGLKRFKCWKSRQEENVLLVSVSKVTQPNKKKHRQTHTLENLCFLVKKGTRIIWWCGTHITARSVWQYSSQNSLCCMLLKNAAYTSCNLSSAAFIWGLSVSKTCSIWVPCSDNLCRQDTEAIIIILIPSWWKMLPPFMWKPLMLTSLCRTCNLS